MRLYELINNEAFEPQTKDVNLNRRFDPRYADMKKSKNDLGSGLFSKVRSTPDPHQVKKSQFVSNLGTNKEDDGFVLFANAVIENKLWNKIHFPRIYVTKKFKDSEGKIRYQWKIEKLEDLYSIDNEELYRLGKRYFHNYDLSSNASAIQHSWAISREVSNAVQQNYFDDIKDETLKEALKTLRSIYEKSSTALDLHTGNMMIRRTSVGPQLVITDPFSG